MNIRKSIIRSTNGYCLNHSDWVISKFDKKLLFFSNKHLPKVENIRHIVKYMKNFTCFFVYGSTDFTRIIQKINTFVLNPHDLKKNDGILCFDTINNIGYYYFSDNTIRFFFENVNLKNFNFHNPSFGFGYEECYLPSIISFTYSFMAENFTFLFSVNEKRTIYLYVLHKNHQYRIYLGDIFHGLFVNPMINVFGFVKLISSKNNFLQKIQMCINIYHKNNRFIYNYKPHLYLRHDILNSIWIEDETSWNQINIPIQNYPNILKNTAQKILFNSNISSLICFRYKNKLINIFIHMSYVSAKEAKEIFKVSEQTLRRWSNENKIKTRLTKGGHRRYFVPDNSKEKIIYCRVSSSKQKEDLKRQIAYMRRKFPEYEVISDIGSGINFKRKGFISLLQRVIKGDVSEVVVTFTDRLSRFNYDFFEWLFQQFGCRIISLNKTKESSPEQELSEDIMSIITTFAAKYHGSRKYGNKKNKDLS